MLSYEKDTNNKNTYNEYFEIFNFPKVATDKNKGHLKNRTTNENKNCATNSHRIHFIDKWIFVYSVILRFCKQTTLNKSQSECSMFLLLLFLLLHTNERIQYICIINDVFFVLKKQIHNKFHRTRFVCSFQCSMMLMIVFQANLVINLWHLKERHAFSSWLYLHRVNGAFSKTTDNSKKKKEAKYFSDVWKCYMLSSNWTCLL